MESRMKTLNEIIALQTRKAEGKEPFRFLSVRTYRILNCAVFCILRKSSTFIGWIVVTFNVCRTERGGKHYCTYRLNTAGTKMTFFNIKLLLI